MLEVAIVKSLWINPRCLIFFSLVSPLVLVFWWARVMLDEKFLDEVISPLTHVSNGRRSGSSAQVIQYPIEGPGRPRGCQLDPSSHFEEGGG